MANPPAIAIYGNSDSGKTELVAELVKEFSDEGFEVCTVKHSPSEISLDEEGKDTWRHKQAGSCLTVFATNAETSFLVPQEMELDDILAGVDAIRDPDLIIAEGYKNETVPKVAVGDIDPRDGTLRRFDGDLTGLKKEVLDLIEINRIEQDLPGLDCSRCGYDTCNELARAIYEKNNDLSDCEVREERSVDLQVNGKKVPLERFPAQFVEGGLKGMLRALKGVSDEIDSISLEIGD